MSILMTHKMTNNLKAQTAIEFLILVFIILFFFTMFFLALGENINSKIREDTNKAVSEIVLAVQEEISFAVESKEGYHRKFKVPNDINGLDYEINITDKMVYLRTFDNKYATALPTSNVTGELLKGENIIEKKGGIVYLNYEQ